MTRTFANKEELMRVLLNGEKWYNEHNNIAIVFYDKSDKDVPFKIKSWKNRGVSNNI